MLLSSVLCQDTPDLNRWNVLTTSTMADDETMCPSVYDRKSCHVMVHYNLANECGSQIHECSLEHHQQPLWQGLGEVAVLYWTWQLRRQLQARSGIPRLFNYRQQILDKGYSTRVNWKNCVKYVKIYSFFKYHNEKSWCMNYVSASITQVNIVLYTS